MHIFNTETGQKLITISGRVGNLAYSPDGIQLLVNVRDNYRNTAIKIFEPATGRELRSFNNGDDIIGFSPDGRRILTTSRSFSLRLEVEGRRRIYGASYATLLDAATGRVTGTIGYGPLNVGARAYADVQIARFLGDTAAVSRHEAVLQFITGRGNATRTEIEAFYRNNVRAQIAAVVDREFAGITVPAATITYVKDSLTNFFTTPNQTNFNLLKRIYDTVSDNTGIQLAIIQDSYIVALRNIPIYEDMDMPLAAEAARSSARSYQNILNTRRRQINAPNDAPIDWSGFSSAYWSILNGFNTELIRRMR
jgi:hypothetical protein